MTQICGKWIKYVGKWLNYLINGLTCGKCLRDLGKGQNILEEAQIQVARLKYLRNGFTMLEMT